MSEQIESAHKFYMVVEEGVVVVICATYQDLEKGEVLPAPCCDEAGRLLRLSMADIFPLPPEAFQKVPAAKKAEKKLENAVPKLILRMAEGKYDGIEMGLELTQSNMESRAVQVQKEMGFDTGYSVWVFLCDDDGSNFCTEFSTREEAEALYVKLLTRYGLKEKKADDVVP